MIIWGVQGQGFSHIQYKFIYTCIQPELSYAMNG